MTAPAWLPQARRVTVGAGAGSMLGGPPRAIHHTTEGSTIDGAVATYRKTHAYPTFTIDYAKDDVVQHLPVTAAATAVENASGGVQTNRFGSVCIQIEWVGTATKAFTADAQGKAIHAGPKVRAFFDFLRAHGIPDVWPMGRPIAYPASYGLKNGDRDPKVWAAKAGHYGHSQVPENHHGDPGAIDPEFIKQAAAVTAQTVTKPTPVKPTAKPAAQSAVVTRTKELQRLLGVPQTGAYDKATAAAASRSYVGWQQWVDHHAGHHVTLLGNSRKELVKWLQQQGNRRFHLDLVVDGVPGEATNHLIVVGLHQADGICGATGFQNALL